MAKDDKYIHQTYMDEVHARDWIVNNNYWKSEPDYVQLWKAGWGRGELGLIRLADRSALDVRIECELKGVDLLRKEGEVTTLGFLTKVSVHTVQESGIGTVLRQVEFEIRHSDEFAEFAPEPEETTLKFTMVIEDDLSGRRGWRPGDIIRPADQSLYITGEFDV